MKPYPLLGLIFSILVISPLMAFKSPLLTPIIAQSNYSNQLLDLTNAERQAAGLPPLNLSSRLSLAAQRHAEDMAKNGLIEHKGSDGSNPMERANQAGYRSSYIGENISAGRTTPQEVIDAWMDSPQHRQNILNPDYTDVGFGYVKDSESEYRVYWVELFGKSDTFPQSSTYPPTNISNCQGSAILTASSCDDDDLNREERQLLDKINQYRRLYRLNSIYVSPALNRLANRHVRDLQDNEYNYDRRGENWQFGWSDCPYERNNPQTFDCMTNAPQRLNTGYQGRGYEIICAGTRPMTADMALRCWQNDEEYQKLLLNQGKWQNYQWKAVGVGIYGNYAVLWLGEALDRENSSHPRLPRNGRLW